jgi:hypothetical protein
MKRLRTKHITVVFFLFFFSFTASTQTAPPYSENIAPFVDFLKTQNVSGKDYIFQLFEKYDLIVLCESDHREYSQYEFVYDIVADPRFAAMKGTVYTEVFSMAGTEIFDRFTYAESPEEVKTSIDSIQTGTGVFPVWTKRNIYDFLTRLYYHNRETKPDRRIRWVGSDRYINWFKIRTQADVDTIYRPMLEGSNRDRYMAENIHKDFISKGEHKSLVIMNYRHAFMNDSWTSATSTNGRVLTNVATILKHRLPGRVANVWLHSVNVSSNTYQPILDGRVDAAFQVLGNPSLGFDLETSPLGDKHFELWSNTRHSLAFRDVFHGYVFHTPVHRQKLLDGFPEYYAVPENMAELKRRFELIGTKMRWNNLLKMYDDNVPFPFSKRTERKVNHWLR